MLAAKEKQTVVAENDVQDEAEFETSFTPIQKLEVCILFHH